MHEAKVIVVEDIPLLQQAIMAELHELGHTVVALIGSGTALDSFCSDTDRPGYDLAVIDYTIIPEDGSIIFGNQITSRLRNLGDQLLVGFTDKDSFPDVDVLIEKGDYDGLGRAIADYEPTSSSVQ